MSLTILGEPKSKANSREIGRIGARNVKVVAGADANGGLVLQKMRVGGKIINRKSDSALAYERAALRQIPAHARLGIEGPVRVTLRIFYASERPDLDESVVLDVLQDRRARNPITGKREVVQRGVYRNDRQVREKHVFHRIDRANPRTEIEIETLVMQQEALPLTPALCVNEPAPF
mgnify:FL=1